MWQCNILRPLFMKMVQNNIVLVFIHDVISTESKGELTLDFSDGLLAHGR